METRRRGEQERGPPLFHAELQKSKRNVEHSIKVGGRAISARLHQRVKIHRDEATGLGRHSDTAMAKSAARVGGVNMSKDRPPGQTMIESAAGVEEGPNATTKMIYGEK